MPLVRLLVEYDGARYGGWQRQTNADTVQAEIERAVKRVTGEEVAVVGSGRTDAGVHAAGQVAVFETASAIAPEKFAAALTNHLPEDISVLESSAAPAGFHPTRHAKRKTYRYVILNRTARPAIERGRVWHVYERLDPEAMKAAALHLVGEHDFAAFTTRECAEKKTTTVRTIHRCEVRAEGARIEIEVEGSGFLHNMVRAIAGTLADVGAGRFGPDEIPEILASRDRRRAGRTAPPQGLTLVRVEYGD